MLRPPVASVRTKGRMWRMRKRLSTRVLAAALFPALFCAQARGTDAPDPRVRPGASFTLTFEELGPTWNKGEVSKMEISIPTDYVPKRRFPLLAWFGGGSGTHHTWRPKAITGGKRFICVGLPYRYYGEGIKGGWEHTPWSYYKTMLDELERIVPNIHPELRICGGFSSGGAAVAKQIGRSEGEFQKYFYAFIPGGAGRAMGGMGTIKGRPMLVFCGDQDSRFTDLRRLYGSAKRSGVDAEFMVFEGHGHGMPEEYFPKIVEWMERKVLYARLPEAATRMERALAAKKWVAALKSARRALDFADESRPEKAKAEAALPRIYEAGEKALSAALRMPTAKKLRKFIADWEGCPCVAEAVNACNGLGEKELEKILTLEGFVRVSKLRTFLAAWEGFEVHDKALDAYEGEAKRALEALKGMGSRSQRCKKLKEFASKWKPAPSAAEALAVREGLAREMLDEIKATKSPSSRRYKLAQFVRTYADTKAGEEAKKLLGGVQR